MSQKAIRDELAEKNPHAAAAAREGRSRKAAIKLFCSECCGGSVRTARECEVKDCFLWPYRPGANRVQP